MSAASETEHESLQEQENKIDNEDFLQMEKIKHDGNIKSEDSNVNRIDNANLDNKQSINDIKDNVKINVEVLNNEHLPVVEYIECIDILIPAKDVALKDIKSPEINICDPEQSNDESLHLEKPVLENNDNLNCNDQSRDFCQVETDQCFGDNITTINMENLTLDNFNVMSVNENVKSELLVTANQDFIKSNLLEEQDVHTNLLPVGQIMNNGSHSSLTEQTSICERSTVLLEQSEIMEISNVEKAFDSVKQKTHLDSASLLNAETSLLTNELKLIDNLNTEENLKVEVDNKIIKISTECIKSPTFKTNSSLNKSLGISDEELLKIEKELYDRDFHIYEQTFIKKKFEEVTDLEKVSKKINENVSYCQPSIYSSDKLSRIEEIPKVLDDPKTKNVMTSQDQMEPLTVIVYEPNIVITEDLVQIKNQNVEVEIVEKVSSATEAISTQNDSLPLESDVKDFNPDIVQNFEDEIKIKASLTMEASSTKNDSIPLESGVKDIKPDTVQNFEDEIKIKASLPMEASSTKNDSLPLESDFKDIKPDTVQNFEDEIKIKASLPMEASSTKNDSLPLESDFKDIKPVTVQNFEDEIKIKASLPMEASSTKNDSIPLESSVKDIKPDTVQNFEDEIKIKASLPMEASSTKNDSLPLESDFKDIKPDTVQNFEDEIKSKTALEMGTMCTKDENLALESDKTVSESKAVNVAHSSIAFEINRVNSIINENLPETQENVKKVDESIPIIPATTLTGLDKITEVFKETVATCGSVKIINESVSKTDHTAQKSLNEKENSEFKKTVTKNGVVTKMQNMSWLKSAPSCHVPAASTMKRFSRKVSDSEGYEDSKNNLRQRRYAYNHTYNPQKDRKDKPLNHGTEVKSELPKPNPSKQSAWGNDTAKQLFPNSSSLVIDRAQEEEEMSLALAESICTAQQESERRKMKDAEESLKCISNESDDNEWGKVRRNLPEETKGKNNNNQNYAKGFVDKFGRVDGYSEKHLFMGKHARRKEQEFLKSQTQNKPSLGNPSFFQIEPFPKDQSQEKKSGQQEVKMEIKQEPHTNRSQNRNEDQSQNKSKERPIHGRAGKELHSFEPEFAKNKNQQKPAFNQAMPKNVNQTENASSSKDNHITPSRSGNNDEKHVDNLNPKLEYFNNKHSDNSDRQPYASNRSQNQQSSRNQENPNRNTEYFNRQQNFNRYQDSRYQDSKNQEFPNRNWNQGYNRNARERSQEAINRNQDRSNRNQKHLDDNFGCERRNSNYNNQQQNSAVQNTDVKNKFALKGDNRQEKSDVCTNLSSNVPTKQESSSSLPQTSARTSTLKPVEVKKEPKQEISKSETNSCVGNSENKPVEPKRNVVMSFEGNQNVQCALGVNPNTYDPSGQSLNSQTDKTSCQLPDSLPQFLNARMVQNMPFSQSGVSCSNMSTPTMYTNSALNQHPSSFEVANLNSPRASEVEQIVQNLSYTTLNTNEITNLSYEVIKCHTEVVNLNEKLQAAQAKLLRCEAELFNKRNPQEQFMIQNLPPTSSSQAIASPSQNYSMPLDFHKFSVPPPGFSITPSDVQKIQNDAYERPRNVSAISRQEYPAETFHANAVDQRLYLPQLCIQQGHPYQGIQNIPAQYQQFAANISAANNFPRGRVMTSNDRRDFQEFNAQFYNPNN